MRMLRLRGSSALWWLPFVIEMPSVLQAALGASGGGYESLRLFRVVRGLDPPHLRTPPRRGLSSRAHVCREQSCLNVTIGALLIALVLIAAWFVWRWVAL